MTTQPMQMPRPSDQSIINAQQNEINFLNSNKVMISAAMTEMRTEFETHMAMVHKRLSMLLSLEFKDDETTAKAKAIASGEHDQSSQEQVAAPSV
jgi:hypothetical protein